MVHRAHVQCVGWGCMCVQQCLHLQRCIHLQWCTHRKACVCAVCACTPVHANMLCTYPLSMHAACALCMHAPSHTPTPIKVHPTPVHPCMCALCLHVQGCMCAELKAGTGGTCSVHTSRAHHPWGVEVPGECMQGCVCACMGTRVCGGVCICA